MPHSFFIRFAAPLVLAASSFFAQDALAQCAVGAQAKWGDYFWSTQLYHQTGSSFAAGDWQVRPGIDAPGFMIYGPYNKDFGVGSHRALYLLKVNDITTTPRAVIASLKVYTRKGNRILAHRDISRRDFAAANEWQWFTVHFDNPCFEELETTIYWPGTAQLVFGQVHVVND